MAIQVQCAGCGAKFQASETLAGKRVKCPNCSAAIVVGERRQRPSGQAGPAEEGAPPILVACSCGKKLQAKAELAGKRVKCPACGQPLAIPTLKPAAEKPAGEFDLERLAQAVAGAAAIPSAPRPPLRKKKQPSNTRLIVGLSVGVAGAVLVLLLILLLWPSGKDKELAKEETAPREESQDAVGIAAELKNSSSKFGERVAGVERSEPPDRRISGGPLTLDPGHPKPDHPNLELLKKEYPWLEGSAPFDVAEFLAPIPEEENAAPLYLEALVEFEIFVLSLLVPDEEKKKSIYKERAPQQRKRDDQYLRFDDAWRKDPKSVNLAELDAWLAEYETGFQKLEFAQQRPRCMFPCPVSLLSLLFHADAARSAARVAIYRSRRDLQRGDFERPMQAIETVLRLSRDIRHRGETVSQLVSFALDSMCCAAMVREMLLTPGLRREHCDRLLATLARHEAEAVDPFLESQRVEYLRTRKLLYDFQHRTDVFDPQEYQERFGGSKIFIFPISSLALIWGLSDYSHRLATEKYGSLRDSGRAKEGSGKSAENWRRLLAMTEEDHAKEVEAVNRVWAAILALEGKTLLERQRVLASGSLLDPLRETYVAVFFEPRREGFPGAHLRAQAMLRGTQCLVALRRWQLEHRQPPNDLQTIVKAAGMSGVPIDPYCDQPLRMTLLQGEPVVYSVGKDGKDDRALADWRYGQQPGDFVFRLQGPIEY